MPDEELVGLHPQGAREEGSQRFLHLVRVGVTGQPEPPGESFDVGVDREGGLSAEVSANHACGFVAYPRQGLQHVPREGHLALVRLYQRFAGLEEVPGLAAVEATRLEVALQLGERGIGIVCGGPVAGKEGGGYEVDPLVRTLCGQDDSDQQLQRGAVIEFDLRFGQLLSEGGDDLPSAGAPGLWCLPGHGGALNGISPGT